MEYYLVCIWVSKVGTIWSMIYGYQILEFQNIIQIDFVEIYLYLKQTINLSLILLFPYLL